MSDERRTPENQTEADDQALGEALGSAIRGRVDTPAARPPVSSIAERAAARAKARNTRRAVVGIAASAALVVGGISAWNALESDQPNEVIVIDEPTASPAPQPSTEPTPAPTSEALSEPEDIPQTGSESSPEPPTPESLSTIPAVAWAEFQPTQVFGAEFIDVDHMVAVGDGRVLAQRYGSDGSQVMITENGRDWTVIPMPRFFTPQRFDIAGDRWLVTGLQFNDASLGTQAFFSDDRGATWTDLPLDIVAPGETSRVAAATVSGQNMVLAVESRVHADVAAVIVARGLVPDKESIRGWMGVEGNTVSFTRDESSAPESFELTAEEEEFLYGADRSFVRLYHSAGGPAELVAEYAGTQVAGYGAADGFHLLILAIEGPLKLTSSDGRQWGQSPLSIADGFPVDRLSNYYGSTNDTVWTSGGTAGVDRVARLDGVYTAPLTAELPEGIAHVNRFSVGPAGIAMVALPGSFPDADLELSLQVTKDGYELRYNQPEGGFSLWDLTENTVVYQFDPESEQANMLPEGIRVVEGDDGAPELLIFEDPETGEHLVSFTREELEPWAQDESLLAAPEIKPQQVEAWVGWSATGADWVWQTLSEAFGLTDLTDVENELTIVDLAVGTDYLIARVQLGVADPSETPSDNGDDAYSVTYLPPRWFIATVE
ncbi:MAG: procyclic acidic repetitive family protein [bacterium]|nr:procyclic acidic repetitive family protein [bacterium]